VGEEAQLGYKKRGLSDHEKTSKKNALHIEDAIGGKGLDNAAHKFYLKASGGTIDVVAKGRSAHSSS